jgi:glycosyltransferase involved in cell wall biosynthesis
MSKPWLSVLIPTYNGGKYLAKALNSIAIQDDFDIECLAIDDGSTDKTITILNSFQDRIPLKIIQREPQRNWVANTNYLLNLAQADYVCFLHQDDMWLASRLAVIREIITQFPQASLILNPSFFVNLREQKLGLWRCPLPSLPILINPDVMIGKLLVQNFISIPAPVFKREIALQVGGLDETLWYTADWYFWLKLAQDGQIIYYPKPLSVFRIHSHSQTVTRSSYIQDFRQQLESVIDEHLEAWNTSSQTKSKIRKIANFSIAHWRNFIFTRYRRFSVCFIHLECSTLWSLISSRSHGNCHSFRTRFSLGSTGDFFQFLRQFKNETHQPQELTEKGSSGIV